MCPYYTCQIFPKPLQQAGRDTFLGLQVSVGGSKGWGGSELLIMLVYKNVVMHITLINGYDKKPVIYALQFDHTQRHVQWTHYNT